MFRSSVRTLVGFVAACAIGMAILTSGDPEWEAIMGLANLAALCGGLIGAIVLRGREQRWCLGFSALCAAYFLLSLMYAVVLTFLGGH
jgi:uncharacterized membrane protein YdcZ (DUF606 family)